MIDAKLFQLCYERAREIVARYRAEAPEGCDPQNTWAAIAVGVIGAGATVASGAMSKGGSGGGGGGSSKAPELPTPPEPILVPFDYMNRLAIQADRQSYTRSDNDFKRRHPGVLGAEKNFEQEVLDDSKGDSTFLPQTQNELMNAGLVSAASAFGDAGPTLARGGAAEANVARNLGIGTLAFQDRNRANRQQSLSLAEKIFPRREFGLNGMDAANTFLSNVSALNAFTQEKYKVDAMNQGTAIQQANATAQANAQADASQYQMYGGIAQGVIGAVGQGIGNYTATRGPRAVAAPAAATPTPAAVTAH